MIFSRLLGWVILNAIGFADLPKLSGCRSVLGLCHTLQVGIHDIGHPADDGEAHDFLHSAEVLPMNLAQGFKIYIQADLVPVLEAVGNGLGWRGDQIGNSSMMCLLPFGSQQAT